MLPETPSRVLLTPGFDLRLTRGQHKARRGLHQARVHLTRLRREARERREDLVREMSESGRQLIEIARALVERRRDDERILLPWRDRLRQYRALEDEVQREVGRNSAKV